jgi:chromate transporter
LEPPAVKDDTLVTLAINFALMSLFAIGGANAALPEMHRLAVDVQHWITDRQFADLFVISQITPGPNVIIVTLIGYQAAGVAGALVATGAMVGPTCLFAFFVGHVWDRFKNAPWRQVVQSGMVPVSVGLIAASALVIAQVAVGSWMALTLTVTTAAITYKLQMNPLWIFLLTALIGLADLI